VIVGGSNRENLEFYLDKEPQFELISCKKLQKSFIEPYRVLNSFMILLLLLFQQKVLYTRAFLNRLKVGVAL